MSMDKPIKRDEIIRVLTLLVLFISIVGGREIGNYYASYREMTKLKILFEVTEEDLSRYLVDMLQGLDPDLKIGLVISSRRADNEVNLVIDTPEYVSRWLVGLTVSPIIVTQPEVSDVEIALYIENSLVDEALYSFPKQKISLLRFTDRVISFEIDDIDEFSRLIDVTSKKYSGEIKVTFSGRAHTHLIFLDTWLPFTVTRYPIIETPHLEYVSSEWRSYTEGVVSRIPAGVEGYILVDFNNPTRIHSLKENIVCQIFRIDEADPSLLISKYVQIPPKTNGQYTFSFILSDPGEYEYRILSGDNILIERGSGSLLSVN
jgi:hypothetical protein